MPVHAIAFVRQIKDSQTFDAYLAVAGEALAKHGGKVAQVMPKPVQLEGNGEAPHGLALLEFPNWQAVINWHSDSELADIHALRTKGADVSIFVAGEG